MKNTNKHRHVLNAGLNLAALNLLGLFLYWVVIVAVVVVMLLVLFILDNMNYDLIGITSWLWYVPVMLTSLIVVGMKGRFWYHYGKNLSLQYQVKRNTWVVWLYGVIPYSLILLVMGMMLYMLSNITNL
jgi:hypothetical protein